MTGYPISLDILRAYEMSSTSPKNPGTVLTPASLASFLDSILSPIASMALVGGPRNLTLLA